MNTPYPEVGCTDLKSPPIDIDRRLSPPLALGPIPIFIAIEPIAAGCVIIDMFGIIIVGNE